MPRPNRILSLWGPALALSVLAAGCQSGMDGVTLTRAAIKATWTLDTTEDLALVDPRCRDGVCPRYPNPMECDSVVVAILDSGRMCATCQRPDGFFRTCEDGAGGGLPYSCRVQTSEAGEACTLCDDLFGVSVFQDCGSAVAGYDLPRPGSAAGHDPDGFANAEECFELMSFDGKPCRVCVTGGGDVTQDTCRELTGDGTTSAGGFPGAGGPGSGGPGSGGPGSGGPGAGGPGTDGSGSGGPGSGGPGSGGFLDCPIGPEGFEAGRRAFAEQLNPILMQASIPEIYFSGAGPQSGLVIPGPVTTGMACNQGWGWWPSRTGDWWRSGRPRCAYMVGMSVSNICTTLGLAHGLGAVYSRCNDVIAGAHQESLNARTFLEQRYECIGSPIVFDLDGDGIRSSAGDARFDLAGDGVARGTAWIEAGDALLVLDRDGDGRIRTGRELFGDATPMADGGLARDGFEALAAHDENSDGVIDAADPVFSDLRLWLDDGDGISSPEELATLADHDIVRIHLRSTPSNDIDAAGSLLSLWSAFERSDGSTGQTCDVFFSRSPLTLN